jgi:8-oxo-dGTP diphosphatase
MTIESTITNRSGQTLKVIYAESDPLVALDGKVLKDVHAFCFYGHKLVVVYAEDKQYWTPPGGGIEVGESHEEAVVREVLEESNMKVMHQEFIGYQDIYEPGGIVRQVRSFCIVEPVGEFVADPDGEITEMRLIDPKNYRDYFDWGPVGERLMERALEMNRVYQRKLS